MKCVACCLLTVVLAVTADALVLAERGRPAVCAVDVKAAGESAAYAAGELTNYVARLTGVTLPVGGDAASRIVIEPGDTDLGTDGFEIAEKDGTLFIRGGKRGVLYGVYELLERFGGVGFFASWHEVVPQLDRFEIPAGTFIREKPAFVLRNPFWYDAIHHPAFAVKIRKNHETWSPQIPEKLGGMCLRESRRYRGHTFDLLVPPKEFAKTHPEYFSEIRGRRKTERSQLCLTNPDVVRLVTARLREQMLKEPEAEVFSLTPNDWYDFCECSNCAAVAKEEGATSGPYVRFADAVARNLADEFPDRVIRVGAYQWYRQPPKKFAHFAKNVLFGFAPIECDFSRPIPKSPYRENVAATAELEAWAKIAAGGGRIFDYATAFRDYPVPFPCVRALQGNLLWYRKNNVKVMVNEGQHNGAGAPFAELKAWLGGKLMWNPDQPLEPLLDRFFTGFYGKAAPQARAYFDFVENLPRDSTKNPLLCMVENCYSTMIDDSFLDRSLALWDAAEAAVGDDPRYLRNVRLGKYSVVYTWLRRHCPAINVSTDARLIAATRKRAQWIVAFMQDYPENLAWSERIHDGRRTAQFAKWKRVAEKGMAGLADGIVEEDGLTLIRDEWVRRVKDEKASGGYAARLAPSFWAWCVQLSAGNVLADDGVRYRIRVKARVEFRSGATRKGTAFTGGYCSKGGATKSFQRTVRASEVSEDYAWYDLGVWTKKGIDLGYFWLSVGKFDNKRDAEHPELAAVWVDQFAIERIETESVRQIFRPERDVRTDENVRPVQPIDAAAWIWAEAPVRCGTVCVGRRGAEDRNLIPPEFYRFRKRFTATDEPLTIDVSADERFVLFLDGKPIARGPHRGMVEHWFYQSYELRLKPGEHLLEAVCWQIGNHEPLAQLSWRGGFILKASGRYDAELTTGRARWQVAPIEGTSFTGQGKSRAWGVGSESRVTGASVLHRMPHDASADAVVVRPKVMGNGCGLRQPGWLLFPTAIPDPIEIRRAPGAFRAARNETGDVAFAAADANHPSVAAFNRLLQKGARMVVPARTTVRAIWDLGNYYCAYPELAVSGGAGAEIRWEWTESLRDRTGHKADRAQFAEKTFGSGFGDAFCPDGRAHAVFTTPWWRCGRWCQVTVVTGGEPLELDGLSFHETRYPLEDEGSFACDDPTVSDIRRICTRALQMCFHDMSFDCPYYEQHMYPGDSRVQYLCASALTADGRLPRQAMTLFGEAQRPNGLVPMNFPGRMTQESSTYTLCWIFMFRDWLMAHGKTAWMHHRLPGVRHALDGLSAFENADGLLVSPPGWLFSDYTNPWANGVAPYNRDGLSAIENLFYLYALQSEADVERCFGETHLTAHYAAKARRLAAAIRRRFWSDSRGALADTTAKDAFSEQTLAFSILTGLLTPAERTAAMRLIENPPADLTPVTVYFSHYLFEALFAAGRTDLFLKRLDLWRGYVKTNMSTLQESPTKEDGRDPRSDCHAWGASPLYHLQAHVAGIQPSSPGFGTVRIAPQPGPLKVVKASRPTPHGPVAVDLHFAGGEVTGTLSLPKDVSGVFVWQGRARAICGGETCL